MSFCCLERFCKTLKCPFDAISDYETNRANRHRTEYRTLPDYGHAEHESQKYIDISISYTLLCF